MEGLLSWEDLVKDKIYNAGRLFPARSEGKGPFLQPLHCGLTEKRLINPAKGLNCLHPACVELEALFNHIERVRKWECPLCLSPLPYYQIFIDLRLKQILAKLSRKGDEQTSRVEVYGDGSWQVEKSGSGTFLQTTLSVDTSSVMSLYPVTTSSSVLPSLSSLVNSRQDPSYLLQFPWNRNDVLAFNFQEHTWVPVSNLTNSLRKYSFFTMIYTSPLDLYICGGVDYEYYQTPLVHYFHPKNNSLERKKAMSLPRSHFAGAHVSGVIYVFGGLCNGETLATCEKYTIEQDKWEDIAAMPVGRCCHIAAVRSDNSVMVVAGSEFSGQTRTILIYSTVLDQWTSVALALPHMVESPHFICFFQESVLLLFGGVGRNSSGKLRPCKHVQLLKMGTFQWRTHHTSLLLPVGEAIYPALRDLQTNIVHIITADEESFHITYDLRQEFLQRPVPELTTFGSSAEESTN